MNRPKRELVPHVRIADQFYELLQYLTPPELKLWLALRLRAWRKDGRYRGYVGKSLRRVAKEINMPWASTQRAMCSLESKGFARRRPDGIYLTDVFPKNPPIFDTSFDAAFDKTCKNETKTKVVHSGPPLAHIEPFGINMGQRHHISTPSFNGLSARRKDKDLLMRDEDVAPPTKGGRASSLLLIERGESVMQDENQKLSVEPLTRERAFELLEQIREQAIKTAEETQLKSTVPRSRDTYDREAEEKRRAELKEQARRLEDESEMPES